MWRGIKARTHGATGDDATFAAFAVGDCLPARPGSTVEPAAVGSGGTGVEEQVALRSRLGEFRVSHTDSVLSAARAINPLLDLWVLAAAVDRSVAAPIEALLTALVARTSTTATELGACADEVVASLNRL